MKTIAIISILLALVLPFGAAGQDQTGSDSSKLGKPVSTEQKSVKPKAKVYEKKIAITFDNLPGDQIYEPEEIKDINYRILAALEKHKVRAAGFVIGEYIEGAEWELIVKWLDAGHTIGFHTYSGQSLYDAPLAMFLEDVRKGQQAVEDLVTTYKQTGRYFRFPFLQYPTDEKMKEIVIDEFVGMGIRIAHVSMTTEDFVYNMSLEKIYPSADSLDLARLREEYIAHFLERLGHAETVADEVVGRPIRHILQLRTNRLNALFLDDLLTELEDKGYRFVDLRHALADWVYRKEESYFGTRGLTYPERIKHSGEE